MDPTPTAPAPGQAAFVQSLVRSGALVTRAAAIMLALFIGFALSDLLPLAMVGFALAVGVFVLSASLPLSSTSGADSPQPATISKTKTRQAKTVNRVPVHLDNVVATDIARGERQKPGRVDGARVADEHEAVAIVHALRTADTVGQGEAHPGSEWNGSARAIARAALRDLALQDHTAILRSGRALDVERRALRQVVHAVEHALELIGAGDVVRLRPAG